MKAPSYMVISKPYTKDGEMMINFRIKWWGWPILFIKCLIRGVKK